jgi:hypothetical protein
LDSNALFVVEGIAEVKFLTDVTSFFFAKRLDKENFLKTGGYNDRWIELNVAKIQTEIARGFHPVFLADANGNFVPRQQQIIQQLTVHGLQNSPLFLFPNNQDAGDLETLLLQLTVNAHAAVNTCFDNYSLCLPIGYTKPDRKDKVYAYAAAVLQPNAAKLAKEEKRDYADGSIWNLNHQSLNDLRAFIAPLL